MKHSKIKLSRLEILLTISVLLIIGIPLYVKIHEAMLETRVVPDGETTTVIHVTNASSGKLKLNDYNVFSGKIKQITPADQNLGSKSHVQLNIQSVDIIEVPETLIEFKYHAEPFYSFNKNILLITGSRSEPDNE